MDAMKLMTLFCLNTRQKEKDGRFTIDCKKGLWGVSAPTKDQAQKEALHYFVQYLSDGEYDQPNDKNQSEGATQ